MSSPNKRQVVQDVVIVDDPSTLAWMERENALGTTPVEKNGTEIWLSPGAFADRHTLARVLDDELANARRLRDRRSPGGGGEEDVRLVFHGGHHHEALARAVGITLN